MTSLFALQDTARLRNPVSPAEGRVAVIVAIEARPDDPDGSRYKIRFPNGDECDVYAAEIRRHNRDADRRAIITALSAATNSLRKACLIAHDYDEDVTVEILFAFSRIVDAARTHLGADLDPRRSRQETGGGPDGGPR